MIIRTDEYHEKGSYSIEPILKRLESIVIEAVDKSKSGLSVMGTLPGELIQQGKYNEAHNIEIQFDEAIHASKIPATFLCLYKSLPKELEGRFSGCHDLIIKRAVTSTGLE